MVTATEPYTTQCERRAVLLMVSRYTYTEIRWTTGAARMTAGQSSSEIFLVCRRYLIRRSLQVHGIFFQNRINVY